MGKFISLVVEYLCGEEEEEEEEEEDVSYQPDKGIC